MDIVLEEEEHGHISGDCQCGGEEYLGGGGSCSEVEMSVWGAGGAAEMEETVQNVST